ncbi:hypothetical protein EJ04DRAFT_537084 [Polyplosphaeria fusca]|uniref:Uncharacterized protein n=1 Tax=Polyplosphaeria fusca TaxID=682080 RepID=A0A9P4QQ73_9PLEO|nr:hypothetical protein EJ04DRAFT_537084 [Polyplosphaeria fusca]
MIGRKNPRRSSARRSFTSSAIPASPVVDSPRTLCPRDGHNFNYKTKHLTAWNVPQDLWENMPQHLKSVVASLQHAGAAVLTSFERMEKHDAKLVGTVAEMDVVTEDNDILPAPQMLPNLDASFTSSDFEFDRYTAVFGSQSETSTSSSPALSASQSQTISPTSPFCLTPLDPQPTGKRGREYSFSTPMEPNGHYYATELSHLRTEVVPHLRHAARKIDIVWYETKCSMNDDATAFEQWWAAKMELVRALDEKCKTLSEAAGMGPTGMGWTAP